MEQLAERTGLSVSQLSRIEKHERGWSVASLQEIAKALNVDVVELLDASNAWQEVELLGSFGVSVWTRFKTNGKAAPTVRLPAALGNVLAVAISGPAFYPRYSEGDVIAVTEASTDPMNCVGRECLVSTDTGYFSLKIVQPGLQPGHLTLVSHNEPPVVNRAVVTCRPVVFVSRA